MSCCINISFSSLATAIPGTFIFRGYIDCSTNPLYPPANSGDLYVVTGLGAGVQGRIGGASGALVEDGDNITAITDNAGGTQAAVGIDWSISQANITYTPENAADKDASNGYVGLTLFKINFLNALGSFTSFFTNSNTGSRTYSFPDRDGTIADNTDLAGKVTVNAAIVAGTNTKITYDTKGLVTAGTAATTADISDSTDRRYVTDANLVVINNTSGTNTGNETTQTIGNLINSANSKTTPVDADQLGLMDSGTGNILTKLSWANVKATLKTYFDALYQTVTLTNGNILIGNGSNVATSVSVTGDVTISNTGVTAIGANKVTEAMQLLADNTTNNVSTTKHGYAPKAPNNSSLYLDGTGAYSSPVAANPAGAIISYAGVSVPSGYLYCDGSAISRGTYSDLFSAVSSAKGTFTVTIATPAVVTLNSHGLATGDCVSLTTTGALPTGLSANTNYYVIYVDANTFRLATSYANALVPTPINTTGSQSGTHSLLYNPYGISGASNFLLPDSRAAFLRGDGTSTLFTQNKTIGLGHYDDDHLQELTGQMTAMYNQVGSTVSGVFSRSSNTTTNASGTSGGNIGTYNFAASGSSGARTDNETAGKSLGVKFIIKY